MCLNPFPNMSPWELLFVVLFHPITGSELLLVVFLNPVAGSEHVSM